MRFFVLLTNPEDLSIQSPIIIDPAWTLRGPPKCTQPVTCPNVSTQNVVSFVVMIRRAEEDEFLWYSCSQPDFLNTTKAT